jgi:hypothetical protein
MEKLRQQIEQRLSAVTGDACFYYENLATGVCFGHAADKPVVAASSSWRCLLKRSARWIRTLCARTRCS